MVIGSNKEIFMVVEAPCIRRSGLQMPAGVDRAEFTGVQIEYMLEYHDLTKGQVAQAMAPGGFVDEDWSWMDFPCHCRLPVPASFLEKALVDSDLIEADYEVLDDDE